MRQKIMISIFGILFAFLLSDTLFGAQTIETPLLPLREELSSFFVPVSGKVTSVEGSSFRMDIGRSKSVRSGMRLQIFIDGEPFIHPVTKESIGNIEKTVGRMQVAAVDDISSSGNVIDGKVENPLKTKVKIPSTKVRILFYQGNLEWELGDSYYNALKESGRFEMVDSVAEKEDLKGLLEEAKTKTASVVIILNQKENEKGLDVTQRIFWADDGKMFSEKTIPIEMAAIKKMQFRAGAPGPNETQALLSFRLPAGDTHITVGDFDGDKSLEVVLVAGTSIKVYQPGVDFKLLWDFKLPQAADVLWIDAADINSNGRDELVITAMSDGNVVSWLYELKDSTFVQLSRFQDTFLRMSGRGKSLLAQKFNRNSGYEGKVYSLRLSSGQYNKEEELKLPAGVNIYDFQTVKSADGKEEVFAWDERGFLNLYDGNGVRRWTSGEDFGGFVNTFKLDSPTVMSERGSWSIKDRLLGRNNEILSIKRKPLVNMAKGLGYKGSEVKSYWWNGLGVEEKALVEEIGGKILDYAIAGDRIVVLASPLFGIKAGNILKGENPLGSMLYIFSLKGK